MTLDAAKNNPSLSEFFYDKHKATALNGVDAKLITALRDLGFDDATIDEVKKQDKTTAKIDALKDKLLDTFEKKGTSKKDNAAIEEERKQLNAKIKELEASIVTEVEKANSTFKSKLQTRDYDSFLNTYEYATNEMIDRDSAKMLADTKLKKYLAEKGFTLQYNPDDASNMFKVVTITGLDAFEGNTPVTFKGLADKVIADNKLIKVSGTNEKPQSHNPNNPQPIIIEGKSRNDFSAMAAEMDSQASQLKTQ